MKKQVMALSTTLTLLYASLAFGSETATNQASPCQLDQTMQHFMQKNGIPGVAVAIYDHGNTQTYVYGVTNKDKPNKVTNDTVFEVGSLTKLMTTLLIAEGSSRIVHYQADTDAPPQLNLNSTLPTYLPAYAQNPAFKPITVLNLATFTGSLPFSLPDNVTTDTQVFAYLNSWKPAYPVGTKWQYSNASIGLLGAILQSQYHQPIDAIFQQMIFSPLNMTSTGLLLSSEQQAKLAQGYDKTGKAVPPTRFGFFPSAGDLKSTIADMSKFLAAAASAPNTNHEINIGMQVSQTAQVKLPDGTLQAMAWQVSPLNSPNLLKAPTEMDLGPLPITWIKDPNYDPNTLIDKTGATGGFRAYIAVIPSQQKGIVLLMNRYIPNGVLVDMGRKVLLDLPNGDNKQTASTATTVMPSKSN